MFYQWLLILRQGLIFPDDDAALIDDASILSRLNNQIFNTAALEIAKASLFPPVINVVLIM